jgi:1-acyl-sn-glycerol-3-phosphate acyltransferase
MRVAVNKFFRNCRGVIIFGGLTLNTIFWFVPILLLAIVKLLLPVRGIRNAITRVLMWMGENWVSFNTVWLARTGSIEWENHGVEQLRHDGWYMIVSNHQTWVDIVVLQQAFNRRAPFLKFFIKQQLIWFPFLGIAWWALDMPFMKRYSNSYLAKHPHMKGKDLETTRKACEKFRDTPTSVLNFIEGTRFSEAKRARRNSPYRHLLQPRAGGLAIALTSMGKMFNSMVDVTLYYPDGATTFWDMCCGSRVRVIVDVRERKLEEWLTHGDYQNDREFRKRLHAWLGDIWSDKDALLQTMKDKHRG